MRIHFSSKETLVSNPRKREKPSSSEVPDNIHGSCPHFGITAHDRHAGGKWPVDAEDHELCTSWNNCQVAVCKCVVAPGEWKESKKTEKSKDQVKLFSFQAAVVPDNHFDRVDPDAQTSVFWDDKRHTATAVGHLCVEVHPFSWRRLGHDVEVDLPRNTKPWLSTKLPNHCWQQSMRAALMTKEWSPSPRPKWPCQEDRTWSDLSRPAGSLLWTRHRSHGGWQSRSVKGVNETCMLIWWYDVIDADFMDENKRIILRKAFLGLIPTLIFTWVLFRSHFSRGLEGVNSDTSLPSSSRMLEFSCLMTYGRHLNGSSSVSLTRTNIALVAWWMVVSKSWLTCRRRKDTTSVDSQ